MSPSLCTTEADRVAIALHAYCHTCKHRHPLLYLTPPQFTQEMWQWEAKHRGHDFEFLSPRRRLPVHFKEWLFTKLGWEPWWVAYRENADLKVTYVASSVLTCTLASLASSSTLLAGQEATAINNTGATVRYLDYAVTARVTTGTTPSLDTEIRLYAYRVLDDTPTYPAGLTGTNSAVTLPNAYMRDAGFVFLGGTQVSATSNLTYPIRCLTLTQAFGPLCPRRWGLWITQNTDVNLHATAGNHVLTTLGAYITAA